MTSSYPVTVEAPLPVRFDRIQVLLRVALLAVIGVAHQTLGGLFGALYVLLPVLCAIAISRNDGVGFRGDDAGWIARLIDWVISVYAYLLFVSDRFPMRSDDRGVRLVVQPAGSPTVGGALARLVTTLPHAFVLCVLGIASAFVAFAAGVVVLFTEKCPEALHTFQSDVLAWMGRVAAYHASLVDEYPPFALTHADTRSAHG